MITLRKCEDIANRVYDPLFNAWVLGTIALQSLEQYVNLPPIVATYANTCGDYFYPVFGAKYYGMKGLVAGTALMIGIEATNVTQHIPILNRSSPDLWDLPAAGIGAIEGFFLDRYRKRHKIGIYAEKATKK